MKNRIKSYLSNRHGMSLVEVLTAMALISLVIFCFAPLFLSYLNSINIAGNEIKEVNTQSGIMQTVIGLADTGVPGNYTAPVAEMELELNVSANTTVYRNGSENKIAADSSVIMGTDVDAFKGDILLSNENIGSSYISANGAGMGSAFTCFPASLTDDFHTAQITLCSTGFSFNDLSQLQVWNNGAKLANGAVRLAEGTDYAVKKINESMVALSFYGGGKVSFETSPVVVKYGSFSCEIEVDAPSMIMVGEANSNGDYNYYVSRGQVHPETNSLIVIQREMNSDGVTLTSAMNDVEWVPAENSDRVGLATNQEPYGYYVMCGDNGQIRRFWKDSTTGNYYWGGDYTYKTDIDYDRSNTSSPYVSFQGTRELDTSVSYTYSFHALSAADTGGNGSNGFNLATNKTVYLQSSNIWSATEYGSGTNPTYIYTSDGKLYHYQTGRYRSGLSYKAYGKKALTLSQVQGMGNSESEFDGIPVTTANNRGVSTREDYTWLKTDNSGYYTLTGTTAGTNPITLTSVDAIVISDTSSAGYYTGIEASGTHYYGSGDWTNMDYPSSSYTLYCGYIPAAMDLWSTKSGVSTSFSGHLTEGSNADGSERSAPVSSIFTRQYSDICYSHTERYGFWRGNFGISPYYITGSSTATSETGQIIFYRQQDPGGLIGGWKYPGEHLTYYPYTNIGYALTGKFYDSHAIGNIDSSDILNNSKLAPTVNLSYSTWEGNQQYITNGKVVDITMAYLSHPFAVHIAANPTDDVVYDQSHDKGNDIYYWNNLRESTTYLDCASTVAPSGEKDIPVSLLVGYVMGGIVEYEGNVVYANTVMNNGIVMLRAGTAETKKHGESDNFLEEVANIFGGNSATEEWYAKDATGYQLGAESNVFHQFYYLNSRTTSSTSPQDNLTAKHIGNLYGANYWQNNRHIDFISTNGGVPAGTKNADGSVTVDSSNYNYLRCHPMSNTKVNCVNWGTTWQGYPEAMWGTENGTLLSWDINMVDVQNDKDYEWNDRSVDAEFQSYQWVDNVNGNTFAYRADSKWVGTIGSGTGTTAEDRTPSKSTFNNRAISGTAFVEFGDRCSRQVGAEYGADWQNATSFISVLESVNDVCFANDTWVAVGDWSGKDPADYCGTGTTLNGRALNPYTDNGRGGSWVNVKYWVDVDGTGVQKEGSNDTYLWKAVKISNNDKYNIVQINCLNGMWIATGYIDENENGEQDPKEETAISWTYDPLNSCNSSASAHWRDDVMFFKNTGSGIVRMSDTEVKAEVGGINSCATRND